jgi:enoyl-CoA hydratase/carnithine racemase
MSVVVETADGLTRIELARPEKKNAITTAMYEQMATALEDAETRADVRVVLLHGHPQIFTAGNDLEDFMKHPPQDDSAPVFRFMRAVLTFEKPLLAAVTGVAVGIGTTLLLHCDLAYAADNAQFSLPFVNLGLCPEFGSSLLFPQMAGYHRAAEKLMLGDPMSAADALELGLVNRLLPPDEVIGYALKQAARLSALPPGALRTTKRLMRAPMAAALQAQIAEESRQFARLLQSAEAREAFSAFFERRKPDFSRSS